MDKSKEIQDIKKRLDRLEGKGDGVVVAVVLDKSGSMETKRKEAISGFNEFLEANRKATPNARFVYCLFDSIPKPVEVSAIGTVSKLTKGKYVPGGTTALYDAIGDTLYKIEHLDGVKRVAVAIITDGEENNSHEFTREKISKEIEKAKERGWQFTFIGADFNAYDAGFRIGLRADQIFSVRGGKGLSAGYGAMTNSVMAYTTGQTDSVSYSDEDKALVENK